MSIAILGAGALGSVIGARMAQAGREVTLLTTNTGHLDAIQTDGLILETPEGRQTIRIDACRPEELAETPDLFLLLTKTKDIETALSEVQSHVARGARVATLQNGLGNAERVAALVPADQVLYGTTMTNGRRIAPGHVATQGPGTAQFTGLTQAGRTFARQIAFEVEGFRLEFDPDTDKAVWRKAAFNCALNAICGLTGAIIGQLSRATAARSLAYDVATEVCSIANARGVEITPDEVHAMMDRALDGHGTHKSSMLQDMEARRETEIDSLCSEIVRQGEALSIPTPLNRALSALVLLKSDVVLDR